MDQEEFNRIFRERTKRLAISIIKTLSPLSYSEALSVIRKQIYKSSTSVASNFRAVCRSRSEREKYSKLCVVVEEADETLFWLELVLETNYISSEAYEPLHDEGTQVLKVMSAYKKKLEPKT